MTLSPTHTKAAMRPAILVPILLLLSIHLATTAEGNRRLFARGSLVGLQNEVHESEEDQMGGGTKQLTGRSPLPRDRAEAATRTGINDHRNTRNLKQRQMNLDTLNTLEGMDYSPANRGPPIHN